ncbi:FAD-binding oxidoreductase [Bradyrhizobium commune]|uniref:FAD-binding oxidoreductase n=1 Tax=Bradyrhizobium commune TaxID=83627 RepID=A0A7S9H0U9_9BRAD|nr:FAD-binding oxidoreductase [Bradyrhizobium commune]QPF92983.1 FAD-binding oxidoreductase [Bradyrhizobium commune]
MNRNDQSTNIVSKLRDLLGDGGVLTSPEDIAPYERDNALKSSGQAICVVRPSDTAGVSDVLRACTEAEVNVIPRGGGTGLSGGAVPRPDDRAVILSLDRMRKVRMIDVVGDVLVVDAGITLFEAREAALKAGRTIGLDHGGSGSSQVGGNLGTNAGGNNVLRYGMARDQVLGLEWVLPSGEIIGPPSELRKSNAGYDLRHLLVGSEGTLAVITGVALKLRPAPLTTATALMSVDTPAKALELLGLAREIFGETVSAFELMSEGALAFHSAHVLRKPIVPLGSPWTALVECDSSSRFFDLDGAFASFLERALESGIVSDGALASSTAQRAAFWSLREGIPQAMHAAKIPIVRTDVAVPIRAIPEFAERIKTLSIQRIPGGHPVFFGHVGDGNIHFNFLPPDDMNSDDFRARMPEIYRIVEDAALLFGGTISAEHGIGQTKCDALTRMKSAKEIELMGAIKSVFDPLRILNPNKVILQ